MKSYLDLSDPGTRTWYREKARRSWLSIKNLLANQILQLFLQILLCLLVEVFQEQLKRTLQVVLIIPFNFWYSNILPVLSYLVPTSVLGPLAHVLQQKLVPLVVVLSQPFLALTLSLFSLVRFLLWPLAHLFGAFLWPLSKFLFQLTLDCLGLLVRPMLQLVQWQAGLVWDSLVLPLLSALYRVALERSKPIVDFLVDKVGWPLVKKIAPHLQQKELLKKLAYPFVTGFSHIQTYLLPNWFLTNVEIFICHLFGHTYNSTVLTKDKDIALVVVVSFILMLELLVILFGYVVKGCYLFVWWWMHDFPVGRLLAPGFVNAFFARTYATLAATADAATSSSSSSWTYRDIFVWWPNIAHHELGAALCIIVVLTTTMVVCVVTLFRVLYLVARIIRKRWRKRKAD